MTRNQRILKIAFVALIALAVVWRLYVAIRYQSRAWIDEMWVVLCPAYKLLTGAGEVKGDWAYDIRSYLPPSLVFLYLKALDLIGVRDGRVALAAVRVAITLVTAGSFLIFIRHLAHANKLKWAPVLPALALFFVPEFVHYGATADLSVLGLPILLLGLTAGHTWLGFVLLCLSALIRFQYGVFPALLLVWFLARREHRLALRLAAVGALALVFEVAFNSYMYGRAVFPLLSYLRANTVGGMASSFGEAPFYLAFEILWRFMTEPVFALVVFMCVFSVKRLPFLTISSLVFFLLHMFVGHKEYRFFYGPAVLLTAVSAASFQKWVELNPARVRFAVLWIVAFAAFAGWRAEKKVRWADYEIPSRLETLAGAQSDIRGLISFGWSGVYAGCNYTLYRPLPSIHVSGPGELPAYKLKAHDFNYVVAPESQPPCAERVEARGGAGLYRCSEQEILRLIQ